MICLFPHCGFVSETSRMLAIHEALRAIGEPVCVATHGGPWECLLDQAGVRWFQLEPRMDAARCARFIQDLPGIGSPNQSMYADEEMLAHARSEAAFMGEHGVEMAVAGFTLTTLLSSVALRWRAGLRCAPAAIAGERGSATPVRSTRV